MRDEVIDPQSLKDLIIDGPWAENIDRAAQFLDLQSAG